MKRYFTIALLGLGLCQAAWGSPSALYLNPGVVTDSPVVDALAFVNQGTFNLNNVLNLTNVNATSALFGFTILNFPFTTKDTLFFTNTGTMLGEPGYEFDTITSSSRHSASLIFNSGNISGLDTIAPLDLYSVVGATVFEPVPVDDQPIPSQILLRATNIINTGTISVGDCGVLSMAGNNVTNSFAILTAGSVDRINAGVLTTEAELLEGTALQGWDDSASQNNGPYWYIGSPGVYDLFWGVTNAESLPPDDLAAELSDLSSSLEAFLPPVPITPRANSVAFLDFPLNTDTAQWSVSTLAIEYGTNIYYNVVLVNTNFSNTNMTATVGFTDFGLLQYASTTVPIDGDANEVIVQISEPVTDVITGDTVTNAIYLIDDGAYLPVMTLADNASSSDGFSRPNTFELSTATPIEWVDAAAFAPFVSPTFIPEYLETEGVFKNNKVPFEISEYGAQINHNPANVSGSFSTLADPLTLGFDYLSDFIVNLTDPTNNFGRIEIGGSNVDLSNARLRAEGMVTINATNLTGSPTGAVDWGEANALVGATNGALMLSNIFPTTFQRVRGDIYAWSATWQNSQTNLIGGPGAVTNQWHYHVLVVDQNLFGSFPSTVRNLTLTGKSSVVLRDNLSVISQAVINTTNLTIQSSNYFSQIAQSITPATTPSLKNLFIDTNGFLGADNIIDIGFNAGQGEAAPTGRSYTINTITNFGQIFCTTPQLQAGIFENDGTISTFNGGSILIEASNISLGLALTNTTNFFQSSGDVTLSALVIQATNSVINAGQGGSGSLNLTASQRLTDFVPGTPTTNTNSVIINNWTVNDGFSLPVKPLTGDLFGTEIHTVVGGLQQATHVWAGEDRGATAAGFLNNVVIGRLVLDRQSPNSILHFSAAGARNAMYVDYLEVTNYSITNYHAGLDIDPNFRIYFADSNGDPEKLASVPGLYWVPSFAGPNSTQPIPYTNSSIICLMNAAVANSTEIAFWPNFGANYYVLNGSSGTLPDPYLLNNPANWTDFLDCPGTYSFPCNCGPGASGYTLLYTNITTAGGTTNVTMDFLTVSQNGLGTITPSITNSQLALGTSYTLTATPAAGSVFDNWIVSKYGSTSTNLSPTLTFAFVTNTIVTANFIPTPFPATQGSYNGLFYVSNAISPASSGSVTLKLLPSGSFSGKLLIGTSAYNFTSQFTGSGAAQFTAKGSSGALTVNLQLDVTGQTGEILGDVNGGSWDASLAAVFAPTWTAKNPSPLAGKYTMALPWDSGTDTTNAGGDSYGVVTVSPLGVLTLAGALADGTSFSLSAPVSQYGQWPLYIYSASGADSVLGWILVSNGLSAANINWFKAAYAGHIYPGGFDNVLQMTGSPWQAPTKQSPAALSLPVPNLVLSGGDLAQTLTIPVTTKNFLTYSATNASLTITPTTGKFTGWFEAPGGKKQQTISGVVLMNEGDARGYFLGSDESGAVLLQNQ